MRSNIGLRKEKHMMKYSPLILILAVWAVWTMRREICTSKDSGSGYLTICEGLEDETSIVSSSYGDTLREKI